MRFMCYLNMGLNLTILKMSPKLVAMVYGKCCSNDAFVPENVCSWIMIIRKDNITADKHKLKANKIIAYM